MTVTKIRRSIDTILLKISTTKLANSANPAPSAPFVGVAPGPSLFVTQIVSASTVDAVVTPRAPNVAVLALGATDLAPTPLVASDVLASSPDVELVVLAPNFYDLAIPLPQDVGVAPG
ncbi:hypothetical protein F0562_010522 [Nyssa sinensis]|uniref:Uncharacterized protein n=1 Tax=Nyssa sinensis TaxID=561372 RepID=A0A5J5A453_9ASTE|nr:hypothetical protein F0562_010522 [Nyssa sinensis]